MDTDTNTSREIVQVGGLEISTDHTSSYLKVKNDWRGILAYFISLQDAKSSSRKLYARTLRLFFEWTEENRKPLDTLTRKDIIDYKDGLFSRGLSSLSVASYLTSVRKFYEFAEAEKLYPNIVKGVKTPRRVQAFKKQHLTDKQSRELLKYVKKNCSSRDFAMVNLILRTGLRTIEVTRANIEDITYKAGRRVLLVWGKGRDTKDDFVCLTDKAYQPIADYLKQERKGAINGEPLFTSESPRNAGERLTTRTISKLCKDALVAIGLDGKEYTAHSLRHTAAVAILKHGGQLTDAQEVLRHASPTTTQIYTESIKEELRLQHAPEGLIDKAF